MDIRELWGDENEKPLDRLLSDGGFCGILRRIGCVGDSLSSGEFEGTDEEGNKRYYDCFEHSWGQYLARMTGSTVYNFSRGGMTAKEYVRTFAEEKGYWDKSLACTAYILALGCNDVGQIDVGSIADIDLANRKNNKPTFAGYYARIIQRLKTIEPDAKFFLMTEPRVDWESDESRAKKDAYADLLRALPDVFPNTYVLDFRRYAPVYDKDFREKFFMSGHMNPCGYLLTAKMVASYIDWIIRHHHDDFREVGFIGTDYRA